MHDECSLIDANINTILILNSKTNRSIEDERKQSFNEHSWQDRTTEEIFEKAKNRERVESKSKHQKSSQSSDRFHFIETRIEDEKNDESNRDRSSFKIIKSNARVY